ncbi:MAG: DotG/IcmE/VirB10 family protein [Alphaproteobacteria bacterium]|nr:DotG/IcmE/VirB10 family protein [Alphaproteobacteria bacterium]
MTNNFENEPETNEEFVDHEHDINAPGISKPGARANLAEAWRTRPMFKFMVLIVAVFAVCVAGFSFLGGGTTSNDIAHIAKVPTLKPDAGGALNPYMRQQTEMADKQRAQEAVTQGGSAMPTPVGQPTDINGFGVTEHKDDQINELRAETEKLRQQVQQQQQAQAQQVQQRQANEPFDNSLAEAMQRQMTQLMDSWTPKGIKEVTVIKPEDLKLEKDKAATDNVAAAAQKTGTAGNAKIVVAAGTVSYAQLLTEANSDVPGPILAQIVSGPLAGARAVGSFQVSDGYEKYLVLKFSLADAKGKDYQINAYALDPDTTLGGMATEVDERYFTRVILPAAAGFLQGMGQAIGQGNSTITTNGQTTITTLAGNGYKQGIYNGLGQAAQTMGSFFQNQANLTKPLVRVAAGTPIGMFFVAPVTEPGTGDATLPNPNGLNANGYNGVSAGYPGANAGYGYGTQGNAAASGPYPNYATPGYGYYGTNNNATRSGPGYGTGYGNGYGATQYGSTTIQGYGQ